MSDPTISCPSCKTEIRLTESLAGPLLAKTRHAYERALADKDRAVMEKLAAERETIAAEEAGKAKLRAAADLEAKGKELAELQSILKNRNEQLAEAQKAKVDLLRKESEIDEIKRTMPLAIEKEVQARLGPERDKAKLDAEESLKLRVSEKDQIIASMQNTIADLKRKAEQGSQQLQGEVLELELENLLKSKFPFDAIAPVPKGEFGGDLVQSVTGTSGKVCGTILWEMKRTKNWTDGWIAKLKDDQRRAKADLSIIVSTALPKGVQTFDCVDGVWVADFKCAVPVALALRQILLDVATARVVSEGQHTKMELVYDYLTGPRFRQRLEAIVEKFDEMQGDLDKERKAMTKLWAKREAQINGVLAATAGLYGDLQGIAGKALKEIDGFDLPAIENQRAGKDDDDMAA